MGIWCLDNNPTPKNHSDFRETRLDHFSVQESWVIEQDCFYNYGFVFYSGTHTCTVYCAQSCTCWKFPAALTLVFFMLTKCSDFILKWVGLKHPCNSHKWPFCITLERQTYKHGRYDFMIYDLHVNCLKRILRPTPWDKKHQVRTHKCKQTFKMWTCTQVDSCSIKIKCLNSCIF